MKNITAASIKTIAEDIADFWGADDKLFYADHTHEELSEGAWSVSLEGHLHDRYVYEADWSGIEQKHGVRVEPITHWCLAIYPEMH